MVVLMLRFYCIVVIMFRFYCMVVILVRFYCMVVKILRFYCHNKGAHGVRTMSYVGHVYI